MASAEEAQAVIDKFNSYVSSFIYIIYNFIVVNNLTSLLLLHFFFIHVWFVKV